MNVTATLSEWATGLRFEDLPAEVVDAARRFLYDTIGCALGGYRMHDVKLYLHYLDFLGGRGDCHLFGSGVTTNAVESAMANALMVRAMDYNDIYWKQDPSHPSDLIPAVLSLAEQEGLDGKEAIVGIVLAYEVEMRLCEAAIPGIRERGWHHATLTAFASPVAAARMLRLSTEQMVNAIGISGCHQHTLGCVTAGKLGMMKNTVDPMATRAGVEAALLARLGYNGPAHVIDGKEGMVHCLGKDWDLSRLTDGLGESFRIVQCGMKAYPTEALTHSPITATLQLLREHKLAAESIAEVRIETIARAADILSDPSKYDPRTKETADHSLPYCIAAALADGQVTPQQFTDEKILSDRVRAQLPKVKVVANEEFEKLFPANQSTRVTIVTTSGKEHVKRVDVPKGDPRDPMTESDLKVKFNALAEPIMTAPRCDRIREAVMGFERLGSVTELMKLCVADRN